MVLWILVFNLLCAALTSCASTDGRSRVVRNYTPIEQMFVPRGLGRTEALSWVLKQANQALKTGQMSPKSVTRILLPYIQYAGADRGKNSHNARGQTIAHELTPLHWVPGILEAMRDNGFDLCKPSVSPDRHSGSTLAHNIAGMFAHSRFRPTSDAARNAVSALIFLHETDSRGDEHHFWSLSGRQNRTVFALMNHAFYDDKKEQEDQTTLRDMFVERLDQQERAIK